MLGGLFCILAAPSTRASGPKVHLSQLEHSTWRLQDGVFTGAPRGIAQTKDGYLWIGTVGGLVRFDGVRFVPWQPPEEQTSGSMVITSLLAARDGSLWIGTTTVLLHWTNGQLIKYAAPPQNIRSIFESRDGTIWIARAPSHDLSGPICKLDGPNLHCYGKSDGIGAIAATSIAEDRQGNLWFGGYGALIERTAGRFQNFPLSGIPLWSIANAINGLAVGSNDSMWVAVGNVGPHLGLEHFVDGHWTKFSSAGFDGSSHEITALFRDREGCLWVGTEHSGIYRIDGSQVDTFDRADGLSSNSVTGFQQDSEGDLWVTTAGGLDVFRRRPVVTYSSREGLSADGVNAVIERRDGSIWMANAAALDSVLDGEVRSISKRNGLPGRSPTALLEDHQGRLWVGVDSGLFVYANGRFSNVVPQDSLGTISGIAQDLHGNIWAVRAGNSAKLFLICDLKVQEQFDPPTMPWSFGVFSDQHGGIWIDPVQGGLIHFNGETKEEINLSEFNVGKPRLLGFFNLFVETDGTLWGASNRGLFGYRKGKAQTLALQNGLPCNAVYSVIEDAHAAVWLYTQCGLIRIDREELERWWANPTLNVRLRLFDAIDGVQPGIPLNRPSATRSDDGRLWFANGSVVQVVDPDHLETNPREPPVSIEQLSADGHPFPVSGKRALPALTREIQIDYTALSFVLPGRVRFRYRLEGYEPNWEDPGTRRAAFYNNLSPGHYRFHVIASNNDGLWNNTGAVLDFSIAPAFYQTYSFRLICVLLGVSLLWAFYLYRLNRATAQVQERLGARMEERERIARELHDTLLQGFQGLMLRFQAVLKTLPSDGPAHQLIEQVLDRADEVLFEGRQRVRDLREEGTRGTELAVSLQHCGEELALGQEPLFSLAVVGDPQSVAPVVFSESYCIAREALINAFQHSRATRIEVEITFNTAGLCIRVRDNGIGIDDGVLSRGRTGHWGLSGMRERAYKMGAQINIWSNSGAGTEIELTVSAKVAFPGNAAQTLWQRITRAVKRPGEAAQWRKG
jgi:signal transduction histidine kinase/ligand-binding sensor domain-containing protein